VGPNILPRQRDESPEDSENLPVLEVLAVEEENIETVLEQLKSIYESWARRGKELGFCLN
jgi:hypothetical protein